MEAKKERSINIDPGFIEQYKKILGDRYDEFLKTSLSPLRKAIRVNTLKISVPELKKRFKSEWDFIAVPWCKEGFWMSHKAGERADLGNLLEHALGFFYVQDPASMIPPMVLEPKPGDIVLDMCAAPGSKSTQIGQYLKGEGMLLANDNSPDRLKSLEINIRRMGITNALISFTQGAHLDKLLKKGILFDKILLDAPCSGSGTIRKSYKTLLKYSLNFIKRTSRLQKQLIETAYRLLKPGGTLVYSTCTLEPLEDEEVINHILEREETAEVQDITLPITKSKTFSEWEGKTYRPEISKCLRIYPQDNDTEGFFVAKIKKNK